MITINEMTVEQKILQTKIALMKKGERLSDKPGAAFFFGQIITEADEEGLDQLRSYVNEVYEDADIPPLITSDFENGCGSMVKGLTQLPYLMGLGASKNTQLAYDYGKVTALEARSLGANWSFSPVSDLNINPRNPLVNVRALTDDADLASEMLSQVVRGMQENGIAACAKHFPGDGLDYRDQHIVTTVNSLSFEEWKKQSGKVFQALIDSGVDTIMPGHISLPSYQKERDKEFQMAYPATLSKELITDLLKGEMGFDGVVVTDALDMGGFSSWYDTREEAEIESFRCGCDMLLWPSEKYVENMKQAIETGYISMERLDDAVTRILRLKEKLGLFQNDAKRFRDITREEQLFIKETQQRAFAESMTLMRNQDELLPIDPNRVKKILLIPIVNHKPTEAVARHLAERLEKEGFAVDYQGNLLPYPELQRHADNADLILYALFSRSFRPMGFLDYYDLEAGKVQTALSVGRRKSVVVSFGSPYFYQQYFGRATTFVNAYSMLDGATDAFVDAALGRKPFADFSPVMIKNNEKNI